MLLMIKLRKGTFMACNKRRRVKDGDKEVFRGMNFLSCLQGVEVMV